MKATFDTLAVAGRRIRSRRSGLSAAVRKWWKAYLTRRNERLAILQLYAMNDRELGDIGITRSQIEGAVRGELDRRPFSCHY